MDILIWGPTTIWVVLTLAGIVFSLGELKSSLEDLRFVKKDRLDHVVYKEDPRVDAAKGNFSTAWKTAVVQSLFLLVALITILLRINFTSDYREVNLSRTLITPSIFIIAEALLLSTIMNISKTRKSIKAKAEKILLNKQKSDKALLDQDINEIENYREDLIEQEKKNEQS